MDFLDFLLMQMSNAFLSSLEKWFVDSVTCWRFTKDDYSLNSNFFPEIVINVKALPNIHLVCNFWWCAQNLVCHSIKLALTYKKLYFSKSFKFSCTLQKCLKTVHNYEPVSVITCEQMSTISGYTLLRGHPSPLVFDSLTENHGNINLA